jgi:hypothetical protein
MLSRGEALGWLAAWAIDAAWFVVAAASGEWLLLIGALIYACLLVLFMLPSLGPDDGGEG